MGMGHDGVVSNGMLTIDVASEIRLLGAAQLQGVWLVPTELIRFAVARGAQNIEVVLTRSGFEVGDDGDPISTATLEAMVTALSESNASRIRHQALELIERTSNLPLLWAAVLSDRFSEVHSTNDGVSLCLRLKKNQINIEREAQTEDLAPVRVRGSARRWSQRRARAALSDRCRFVEAHLRVDGKDGQRGFPEGMYRLRFNRPLDGIVATTRSGDSPRLWLLQNGVLASRATIPRYPPFEAALELGSRIGLGSSPAEQRIAVTPFLSDVVDHALMMLIQLGRRPEVLEEDARVRITEVLLDALSRNLRREEIKELPLLPSYSAADGSPMWISIAQLQRSGRAVVPVAESTSDVAESALGGDATLVLPVWLRARVGELAQVKLETTTRSKKKTSLLDRFERLRSRMQNRAARRRLFAATGGVLVDDELEGWERTGLDRLRKCLGSTAGGEGMSVVMCFQGTVPVRRGREIRVPRTPDSQYALRRAAEGDTGVLYPMLVAAVGDRIELPSLLRREWIRSVTTAGREMT